MRLGELLVAEKIVEPGDIELALRRQLTAGGTLGDNLIALGKLTEAQLETVFRRRPLAPTTIAETGLDPVFLMSLVLKCLYIYGYETAGQIAAEIKLRVGIVQEVLDIARQRGFVEHLLQVHDTAPVDLRYSLSSAGKQRALEMIELSQYVGPAPVTLAAYRSQVARQRITHERLDRDALARTLSHLVLPDGLISQVGPAMNAGQVILFYGPAGNGKTAIARALANAYESHAYIPFALLVDGQIIKVFDASVHEPMTPADTPERQASMIRKDQFDWRWVSCRRPVVVTGCELTLEMLDVAYNSEFRYYEAPLQLRAAGGVLLIDDFGHQSARATDLLNRWLSPLERGVDHMTLRTGKSYEFPLDQIVMFLTNIEPARLMDPAMFRRFPFKIGILPPDLDSYLEIFRRACIRAGLDFPAELPNYLMAEFYDKHERPLAAYHPDFIINYVVARCRFEGVKPELTANRLADALGHLYVTP